MARVAPAPILNPSVPDPGVTPIAALGAVTEVFVRVRSVPIESSQRRSESVRVLPERE